MEFQLVPYQLVFKKPAKTSRNVFLERQVYFIVLRSNNVTGIGEASPLKLLSIDDVDDYQHRLEYYCTRLVNGESFEELDLDQHPSIRFGIETALLDLKNGGERHVFRNRFINGHPSRINGLVWMNDLDEMYTEALQKIDAGFSCIKFKVGAHDFDAECRLLEKIRANHSAFKLEIRLDANGAFLPDEASKQLREFKRFDIHSIEQPIKPKQWDDMARLCHDRIIDIALDEELIGLHPEREGLNLLTSIHPHYLIIKPNLIGGFEMADSWVSLCHDQSIGWWATSALESNIGLNAIAQWVNQYEVDMPQGLGTGSLYTNNIPGPLQVVGEHLRYTDTGWDISAITQ
ncbi:MAG: o-succinylbenzoate synthase [Bacteroidia bacterium]|nr:o-succinylbenzoate synthase [Bacteroidia bacterium]